MCSIGTAACLHQQVLRICSAILQLVMKCGHFHSRLVFYGFTLFNQIKLKQMSALA